nr:MAG TPA: hypothetical protein [Caudoviricetes sp.]
MFSPFTLFELYHYTHFLSISLLDYYSLSQ